ncbi:MAG: MotA/TolQ/ExbB proton channel family protein [Verrucomicrobiales bacterium]|nr:MotA/TolQ/ExbB proton channel family protein [Verrucomicrobiales bacterium]MCP5526779.1 MotA/TolQ/ExbB proton channel family protein [Verrucomicrobiales bacterium]
MKSLLLLLTALLAASPLAGAAADLEAVAAGAQTDLTRALADLAALREQIEAERTPLARQMHDLEDQVLADRAKLETARRSADNQLIELNVLKAEVRGLSNEVATAEGLLGAYREAFNTRLHVSEASRYDDAIQAAAAARDAAGHQPATRMAGQLELLKTGLDRLERLVGGEVFEGTALNPAGRLERGHFVLLGPTAAFASREGETAGIATLRLNSPEPEVVATPGDPAQGIRDLARSGQGTFPVDASLGNAIKIQATQDSLVAHIRKGGPVMGPILLLGFAALGIFLFKWLQVGRVRVALPADLTVILAALDLGDEQKAASHARKLAGPVGDMLASAIAHFRERKEYVEEVMYEKMLETRPRLEKLLPFLALSAAAAPLLGLLGTVTGMINTFNMITVFGTGDPKTLAGGISEALITTEFGLVVAIPSLLLHAILSRKVKGVLGSMEQTTVAFINGLPGTSQETQFFQKLND